MSKLKFGSALAACAVLCAGTSAFAQQAGQPVPNIANYQELRKSFRIGIRVNNQLNGFDQSARFEQDTIDDIIERDDQELVEIYANLFVERDSQKGIIIGHAGSRLKEVGARARAQIEPLVGKRVFLSLRVKVAKEWQRDPKMLGRLGF